MAALPSMVAENRKQAGWSVGQTAWRLGLSVRTYREIEADRRRKANSGGGGGGGDGERQARRV